MPLAFAAAFLPFAALIALVAVWPRRHASGSRARPVAEAFAVFVLAAALFYGTVTVLQWVAPRW